jgi:hypothetical protein
MKSAIFAAIIGFAHTFSPAPPVAKTALVICTFEDKHGTQSNVQQLAIKK